MGLFKKRQQSSEEFEVMRAEMQSLRKHLDETDAIKDRLAERLRHLDSENERLKHHVSSVSDRVGEVADKIGTVEQGVVSTAESIVEKVIRQAAEQLPETEDPEVRVAGLQSRLEELNQVVRLQQSQIADVALVATDAAERSEQTDTRVDSMAAGGASEADAAEAARQFSQLAEKVASLDSRVNQVSLELTNQLTELSSDLDRVGDQTGDSELIGRINSQLDVINGGQERLASEQARHAIQFRADLAELADRLKRKEANATRRAQSAIVGGAPLLNAPTSTESDTARPDTVRPNTVRPDTVDVDAGSADINQDDSDAGAVDTAAASTDPTRTDPTRSDAD